jgi:hypothetical protein
MLRFLGQRFSLELCASVVKNRAKKQNGKPEGLPSKNQKTPKLYFAPNARTLAESRDLYRAAVFLCSTPF